MEAKFCLQNIRKKEKLNGDDSNGTPYFAEKKRKVESNNS